MEKESKLSFAGLIISAAFLVYIVLMFVPVAWCPMRETPEGEARGDIASYENALDLYALDHDKLYPKTLNALVGGDRDYLREIRRDPWGSPYVYLPPSDNEKADYAVFSLGPDRKPGTPDDVTRNAVER